MSENSIDGKISVIMGIYNCEDTLSESIQSIIDQTYKNWELIMCDDASTDNTLLKASQYVDKYPDKIKVIRNHKNIGLAATLNNCLKHCTGEFIARMDGDDISFPNRFEKQIHVLEKQPELMVVGSSMLSFDDNGEKGIRRAEKVCDKYTLLRKAPFFHATILARKAMYTQLNGYHVSRRTVRGQDFDLWFRFFSKNFKGSNLQEPLYKVREDTNQVKRKKFKYRIHEVRTLYFGLRLLGYPLKYYLFLLKPLLASITPHFLLETYYKKNKTS